LNLWSRVEEGHPTSIWLSARSGATRDSLIADFRSQLLERGARCAAVSPKAGHYLPLVLERDVAESLWPVPGAAGVNPEHREAIEAFSRGEEVAPTALRRAVADLLDAVAEEGPLAIFVPSPRTYSQQALRTLVSTVGMAHRRPILLLMADRRGVPPISPQCLVVTVDDADSPGRTGASLAAVR
jgi:hypothetical protein